MRNHTFAEGVIFCHRCLIGQQIVLQCRLILFRMIVNRCDIAVANREAIIKCDGIKDDGCFLIVGNCQIIIAFYLINIGQRIKCNTCFLSVFLLPENGNGLFAQRDILTFFVDGGIQHGLSAQRLSVYFRLFLAQIFAGQQLVVVKQRTVSVEFFIKLRTSEQRVGIRCGMR